MFVSDTYFSLKYIFTLYQYFSLILLYSHLYTYISEKLQKNTLEKNKPKACNCFKPLQLQAFSKSDRRGSNPRSRPWQGRALPTTPLSQILLSVSDFYILPNSTYFVNHFFNIFLKTFFFLQKYSHLLFDKPEFTSVSDSFQTSQYMPVLIHQQIFHNTA